MTTVKRLPSLQPDEAKTHHIGNPPTGFQNPWPSFTTESEGLLSVFRTKFARDKPAFVPVPDRAQLAPIHSINFDKLNSNPGFRVTWIGHASFLLQTSRPDDKSRGINILCDPVFSERTSPVTFLGPKRYSPTPCTLHELLDHVDIDLVLISHNHYDHADIETLKTIYAARGTKLHFVVGLHSARWLTGHGIARDCISEVDWWDQLVVVVDDLSVLRITCAPTQHFSSRSPFDRGYDLWCAYAIEELHGSHKKLFFAGDTGYRSVHDPNLTREQEDALPTCPAFKQVGGLIGPFDLALLPIGLCEPRVFMSKIHANSWDSIRIHQDLQSRRSIGMHWGTVRGEYALQTF